MKKKLLLGLITLSIITTNVYAFSMLGFFAIKRKFYSKTHIKFPKFLQSAILKNPNYKGPEFRNGKEFVKWLQTDDNLEKFKEYLAEAGYKKEGKVFYNMLRHSSPRIKKAIYDIITQLYNGEIPAGCR